MTEAEFIGYLDNADAPVAEKCERMRRYVRGGMTVSAELILRLKVLTELLLIMQGRNQMKHTQACYQTNYRLRKRAG